MKKTGLFKIIMFVLLGVLLVTWFVPAGYFANGELSDLGMYRIGFFDFFQLLFGSYQFSYFIQIIIFLLSVGALYGVLGKTGKYRAWLEKIASKFKGKEFVFLIIVAFVLAALSSVFSYGLVLFIFIPAIISIILLMGYDKITALLATFGAMLVGTIGSTLNSNINGTINAQLTSVTNATGIYFKLALFVLSLAALLFYLSKAKIKKASKKDENASDDMFVGEKNPNKRSVCHIIIVFAILFVLVVLGCTTWSDTFGVSAFTTFNTKLTEFTIKDVTIFKFILGTVNEFGKWYLAEMSVMCVLAALLIGKVYKQKPADMFANMAEGAKKMIKPATLVVLTYAVVYFAGNTMFFGTIANKILTLTDKFNLGLSSVVTVIGSALHVDMLYITNYVVPQLAGMYADKHAIIALMVQSLYGLTMFVTPTSAFLVLGLSYLEVPYTKWIKSIWKLVLGLAVIVIAVLILAMYI